MIARRGDLLQKECPGRILLDHITGKWGVLVLTALEDGSLRFHELRDRVDGVSDKMLAQTLRVLASDGLVERTVVPTSPPSVSYELTGLGHEATSHLEPFLTWVVETVARCVT